MRLIDFDKIPFLAIPIAPVVKGENVHYEQGALKEWFDGMQDVQVVPLDRIKEARREMEQKVFDSLAGDGSDWYTADKVSECMKILDNLIAEVEG